ncbi:MAG: T9SS type A sorting domain-containing protein [Candidatus Cloacimonetes bacterium]|nr:T9SS type A sorting domain-containing protein [Candidatus Cloacimonadota bacterium]
MKTRKGVFVSSIILFMLLINCASIAGQSQKDPLDMLLIGSSYFNYHNLRNHLQNLADSAGIVVEFDIYAVNGLYLYDHAYNMVTESKIQEKDWDYVILQGCGSVTAYPNYYTAHPVYPALVILRNKIINNCDSTKMVFCMPWAFEDGMTWVPGWTDTYVDMQNHIYDNTLQWSNMIGFEIAPVGWSWKKVLVDLNFPLHYLHMSDWNHPSLRGSYLMACTIFATVFQQSCIGVNYNPGIDEDEVTNFQTVGTNTVLDSLDLWNIEPIYSVDPHIGTEQTYLHQNTPNPFNGSTEISYSLIQSGHVELAVYNLIGQRVKTLYSGNQLSQVLHWDGTDENGERMPSGVYFYQLFLDCENLETKRMILLQ